MQSRVEQPGMDPEPTNLTAGLFGQSDLGEHFLTTAPQRLQPLKHRAILITPPGQLWVGVADVYRLRTGRRPHRQIHPRP